MNDKKIKVGIYGRVSTSGKGQDTENQLLVLREFCNSMNYHIVNEYVDEKSGGTDNRPAFKQMFDDASKRKFDVVIFWSLDRFSREGVRKTIHHLERLESYGVTFKSYTEQYLDGTGLFKDAIISLLSCLARQEKVRLSERVLVGLARAKAEGRVGGRPKLAKSIIKKINELKSSGLSNRAIGRELNISHRTVGVHLNINLGNVA